MKIKLIIIDVSDDAPKKAPVRYFIDPRATPHIDFWKYSPESAKKQIETVF
jgi:small subunit ribosomal protein S1